MDNIRLIFVLPEQYADEQDASEIMLQAFEACRQNVKTDVSWVKEGDFDFGHVNKTDFIIFEEFKGTVFENLKETKCARILGPWAISICLVEGKAIPNFPWPIYNVAMHGCIVTCSNLPKSTKLAIKAKVQIMGGCYVDTLVEKITHLVTDTPTSKKYSAAAEAGVSLMCSSWIEAVWVASQTANVHADDQIFKSHSCLPFQNLNISCTGLSGSREKRELERLITKYGGKFSAQLKLMETDFLVCSGTSGSTSEKYKAARKRDSIKCVDVAWVTDSIAKGYALCDDLYPVRRLTSTPTKKEAVVNPDFSMLSAINTSNMSSRVAVEDTINASLNPSILFLSPGKPGSSKRKANLKEDYGQLVDKLDIKKVKKAGQYLDGYSVYITGFSPQHTEKLCKILNLSGATRYDKFSDRVTHVIVGDPRYQEVNVIKNKGCQCVLVNVHWLLESINNEQPVNEEAYLLSTQDLDTSDFSSPLSKKGLNLLRSNKMVTVTESKNETVTDDAEENVERDIVQQYLKPSTSTVVQEDDTLAQLLQNADKTDFSKQDQEPRVEIPELYQRDTSTQQSSAAVTQDESETRSQMFFEGLKFLLVGFDGTTQLENMKEVIEDFSGTVVPKTYKGIPDYIVVPVFDKGDMLHTAKEVVNQLFISDCAFENCILSDIRYYHRPLPLPDVSPLENTVITISGYARYERDFLQGLIEALGGMPQEQFARVSSKSKGVVPSTHLVIDQASGKKYAAAIRWGLPVVNKEWLLECARTGQRVPEIDYGVHDRNDDSVENTLVASAKKKLATISNTILSNTDASKNIATSASARITEPDLAASCNASIVLPSISKNMKEISQFNFATPTDKNPIDGPGCSTTPGVLTPVNQILRRKLNLSDSIDKPFTQVTPVNKIFQQYRESSTTATTPNFSPELVPWMGIKTPDTPLGACIRADPSPQLRKECEYWLRQFPDYIPRRRRLSTPFSEIKRRFYNKVLKNDEPEVGIQPRQDDGEDLGITPFPDEASSSRLPSPEQNAENEALDNNLQRMQEMLSASSGGRRQSRNFQSTIPIPEGNNQYKDSQACTVGWDFREQEVAPKQKMFILSGISTTAREKMVEQLESLGATVSGLTNYDPKGTHLLCPKPARNEKTLASMAAGLWILHTSYLDKSLEAGSFLDEEEYEFGNPKSVGKFDDVFDKETEVRMNAMHWWRKEITRRGYKAFNDMRAIVVAEKMGPIVRVIEAGGGVVVDISPPYDDTVHATHCFLEQRSVRNYGDYIPLAQQGIYLLNTVYLSDYLHQPQKDVRECILPYFAKFYSRN